MTKTLTEQWREGTLPEGHYYFQYGKCAPFIKDSYGATELKRCIDAENIKVLAPVPSYSEQKTLKDNCEFTHTRLKGAHQKITQLKKKLAKAIDALKDFCGTSTSWDDVRCREYLAKQKLKEMEGVK